MNNSKFFTGVLAIVFITLKLTGLIAWSWWWVLAPIWIPLAILLVIGVVWLFFAALKKVRRFYK